jgi:hypothetical protein
MLHKSNLLITDNILQKERIDTAVAFSIRFNLPVYG